MFFYYKIGENEPRLSVTRTETYKEDNNFINTTETILYNIQYIYLGVKYFGVH